MAITHPLLVRSNAVLPRRLRYSSRTLRRRVPSACPQALIDAIGDGFWDWNLQTDALSGSSRWLDMLGFRAGEVEPTGRFWAARFHPDDRDRVRMALRRHLDGLTATYQCEHRVQIKSGAWLWVLSRGRVVEWDSAGRALRMIGVCADVSARKQAEAEAQESRLQLNAILDNAPVGVLLVDAERRILRANDAIARIFQCSLEGMVGASARLIYGNDAVFEDIGRRAYPLLESGGTFDEETMMRRADGTDIRCRLIGRSVGAGDPALGYIWVIEDVTVRRRAEQALNDRASFQRVLLDTVPVPIFVQDVMGHYVDANRAFEHWMGMDRQALFGKTIFDLAPPDLAATDEAADRALLADQQPQSYETQMRCADGALRDVLFSKAVYCRVGGKPAGIVGALTDISERKRAEQALLERQQLFEQIFVTSCAIKLLIDPIDGRIVDANPAAAEFYGHPLDHLRTLRISAINILSEAEIAAEIEKARSERRQHFLFRHRLASGAVRDVEVYSSPVQVHGRTLLLSLVHDITDRLQAEEGLRRKTRELERSNAELEAFAYVASHDLRQPLRVINSYLTLLDRTMGEGLDAEARECIDFARDGAQRMDRLIVDLLEYSRVGRKAAPFRPVPLAEVVDLALLNLEVAIADAGARVMVANDLPTVSGDDNELMRLFQNLIGNAVKYRAPDRPPVVRVTAAAVSGGWRIDIRDNGIGIPAEDRDRVFGIFQRLHRRDEYEGTGVGLAVCKKIVEHHGGHIGVADTPNDDLVGGSLFTLTLPIPATRHDAVNAV
ncbi:PAS domain-containing sensor histidine kinase [Azospirillum griseum]|nr:PAS domain S-box protein [Azospirillum griseum]